MNQRLAIEVDVKKAPQSASSSIVLAFSCRLSGFISTQSFSTTRSRRRSSGVRVVDTNSC
jgi:hypothetical protein